MIYDFTQTKKSCHCERGPGGAGTEPNLTIILTILFTQSAEVLLSPCGCQGHSQEKAGTERRLWELCGNAGN